MLVFFETRCTVPFMLVRAGKYRTKNKLKFTDNTETKHNLNKQMTENTANTTNLVQSPFTTLG